MLKRHMVEVMSSEFGVRSFKTKHPELRTIHSDINHSKGRHSCESRNPEKHWIPGQARNDKPYKTYVVMYSYSVLSNSGVTLIELISVMAIIGILAATVLPRLNFDIFSRTSVDGAAYIVASDIRYVQECAMANRVSKSVRFTLTQNFYTFLATSPSTSSLDPSGRLPEGVTISNNSTNPYTVTFNSLGEPITGGNGWVEVTIGGQTRRITVVQYTGKVNIS